MGTRKLKKELKTDELELAAVEAAEAAIADTEDGGDDDTEAQALVDAQAAVNFAPTIAEADALSITDFNMVSNDMARKILEAKGKPVRFEEPEEVKSNYYMKPIGE